MNDTFRDYHSEDRVENAEQLRHRLTDAGQFLGRLNNGINDAVSLAWHVINGTPVEDIRWLAESILEESYPLTDPNHWNDRTGTRITNEAIRKTLTDLHTEKLRASFARLVERAKKSPMQCVATTHPGGATVSRCTETATRVVTFKNRNGTFYEQALCSDHARGMSRSLKHERNPHNVVDVRTISDDWFAPDASSDEVRRSPIRKGEISDEEARTSVLRMLKNRTSQDEYVRYRDLIVLSEGMSVEEVEKLVS